MVAYKDEIFYDPDQKASVRRSRQKDKEKEYADLPIGADAPQGVDRGQRPERIGQKQIDQIEKEVAQNTAQLQSGVQGGARVPPANPPQKTPPTPVQRPAGAPQKDSGLQAVHQPGAQTQSSDPMRSSPDVKGTEKK